MRSLNGIGVPSSCHCWSGIAVENLCKVYLPSYLCGSSYLGCHLWTNSSHLGRHRSISRIAARYGYNGSVTTWYLHSTFGYLHSVFTWNGSQSSSYAGQ